MKKLIVCMLALTFVMGVTAFAQQAVTQADQTAAAAPLMTLQGTVKAGGDKVTFVNDADGKSWDVMNPEELKGHDGHHVELSAHVYSDKSAIHIMSVKMLKDKSADSMNK